MYCDTGKRFDTEICHIKIILFDTLTLCVNKAEKMNDYYIKWKYLLLHITAKNYKVKYIIISTICIYTQ